MRHAVILAGGSGTRLWPASRQAKPKQLLPIACDGEPLIAGAISLARAIAGERTLIVTAEPLAEVTRAAAPAVELIAEPAARNTAAAIGLAGALIAERDPDAVIAVLPADHHVRDREGMIEALDACLTAAVREDAIALVGIRPTRAETGYGYLEVDVADGIHPVRRFVEKPDRATASHYVANGHYLWNAGIFCLTVRRLFTELDAHMPEVASTVRQIVRDEGLVLDPQGLYAKLPSISFDYGVMQKTRAPVVAVATDVGWSDVGSWDAIPEVRDADDRGNVTVGQSVVIDGRDNVVMADDGTLIATIGVSDLVVVKSGDAILVVRRDQAQRVREVVEELTRRGLSRYV